MDNLDLLSPPPGQFPYRFTQDDRFQYRVKVQPVASQLEFSIRAVDTRLASHAARRQWEGNPKRQFPSETTDREDNLRASKWRAKAKVKLLAMELGVDRLLTFTARLMGNPLSYDEVLKAWDHFRRLAIRANNKFAYLAVPEKQQNGQWHIHAGVSGFLNVKLYTRMWQASLNKVLGRPQSMVHGAESPGTCNVTKKLQGSVLAKAKNIARYIAKYIGKQLESGFNRKSYFHTVGVKITPAQRYWLRATDRDAALLEVMVKFGLWDLTGPDCKIWNRDGHSAWFTVPAFQEPPPF